MMTKKEICKSLKNKLDYKRYEHTLGVAYTAASMAMKWGEDVNNAFFAGLLHDCAKGMTDKERIAYCKEEGIPITDVEMNNPGLLHAKVGAHLARVKYDTDNMSILSAITYHTTGRCDMTLLEQILFVADYIEPNRMPLPEIETIRKEAFEDLNLCTWHIYRNTLAHLYESTKALDPATEEAYRYYCEKTGMKA